MYVKIWTHDPICDTTVIKMINTKIPKFLHFLQGNMGVIFAYMHMNFKKILTYLMKLHYVLATVWNAMFNMNEKKNNSLKKNKPLKINGIRYLEAVKASASSRLLLRYSSVKTAKNGSTDYIFFVFLYEYFVILLRLMLQFFLSLFILFLI